MPVYNIPVENDGQNTTNGSTGNTFIDWLRSLGNHYYERTTGSTLSSMQGMSNAISYMNGDKQPAADSLQEATDESNKISAGITFNDLLSQYQKGDLSASELYRIVTEKNLQISPQQESWLQFIISQENTQGARDWDKEMRDTSLTSTIDQLRAAGMNPASAISIGGMNTPNGPVANSIKGDVAAARFERNTAMAKTLISLVGSLAGAGVHGAALMFGRKAAAELTTAASKYAVDQKYSHIQSTYYDTKNHFKNTFYE